MGIEKFEHHNNGEAWILDNPKDLENLEEKAFKILSKRQLDFFKNYPSSLEKLIEKSSFDSYKTWLKDLLENNKSIKLEIYEKGYIKEEVLFNFKSYLGKNIYISCNEGEFDFENKRLKNIAETVGKISLMAYSSAGALDPYDDWYLYSTYCGEKLAYRGDKTYWDFKENGLGEIEYKTLDDFLDEFFTKLIKGEVISPEESFE